MTDFVINNDIDKGLIKFMKAHKKADVIAKIKVGIQLINNIVNGSPGQSVTPPIKTGRLRGSGSAFLGAKNIYTTPKIKGEGTPNFSFSGRKGDVTIGFNTPYAARMHEGLWTPGEVSAQAGGVGNKFVEKHLRSDGKELMRLYALMLRKETK